MKHAPKDGAAEARHSDRHEIPQWLRWYAPSSGLTTEARKITTYHLGLRSHPHKAKSTAVKTTPVQVSRDTKIQTSLSSEKRVYWRAVTHPHP